MDSTRKKQDVFYLTIPINKNFVSGLIVGTFSSIVYHPWDRAFFIRGNETLTERQHPFAPKYWTNPWSGLRNTFYQRVFSNSIYFTIQGELYSQFVPLAKKWQWNDKLTSFTVGVTTGAITGIASNAMYAVKFYTFTHKPNGTPLKNALIMWRQGGPKPFINGIFPGVMRDISFGVCYEMMNLGFDSFLIPRAHELIPSEHTKTHHTIFFASRFISACFATTLSSPFNYARNTQFKTRPHKWQPLVLDIWCKTWLESNKAVRNNKKLDPHTGKMVTVHTFPRLNFYLQKFMIGAGTIRASVGMATGQMLFSKVYQQFARLDEPNVDNGLRLK